MFLNDLRIRQLLEAGDLAIDPRLQDAHDIGPFSVDLRLGTQFAEFGGLESSSLSVLDPTRSDFQARLQTCYRTKSIEFGEVIVLHPQKHLIATTLQFLQIPSNLCAFIFPRSSWTRIGLIVATFTVDPGFQGKLSISLHNVAEIPIALYPGIRIVEIAFAQIDSPPIKTHQGKYGPITGPSFSGAFSTAFFTKDPDFTGLKDMIQRRTEKLQIDNESMTKLQELYQIVNNTIGVEKGKSLEEFAIAMFQGIEGLRIIKRNARLKAEELDLVIANDLSHGFWRLAGSPIIVECKNWSTKVGAREIGVLWDKLTSIGPDAKTGILIALNGISGNALHDAGLKIREKRQKGQYIIVLDRKDLDEIVQRGNSLALIERKYEELIVI